MRELKKQETEQKNEHKHVIITQQDKYKFIASAKKNHHYQSTKEEIT